MHVVITFITLDMFSDLSEFVVVTKNIERFDLDRLMIVAATNGEKYFIRVFKIDFKLPNNTETVSIIHTIS